MGTPTEETWPGIGLLPDYKPTFPHWSGTPLEKTVTHLDANGMQVLKELLVLDPSRRISAKRVLKMPYFDDVEHVVATKK